MKLTSKDFLRAIPLAPLAPAILSEGVARYDLNPPGHFVFFVDLQKVDIVSFCQTGTHGDGDPLMPRGSTGGWVIGVNGDVENAVKIFRLNGHPDDPAIHPEHVIREQIELPKT